LEQQRSGMAAVDMILADARAADATYFSTVHYWNIV
jgi:hypothetical protein